MAWKPMTAATVGVGRSDAWRTARSSRLRMTGGAAWPGPRSPAKRQLYLTCLKRSLRDMAGGQYANESDAERAVRAEYERLSAWLGELFTRNEYVVPQDLYLEMREGQPVIDAVVFKEKLLDVRRSGGTGDVLGQNSGWVFEGYSDRRIRGFRGSGRR